MIRILLTILALTFTYGLVWGTGPVQADVRTEQNVVIAADQIVEDDLYVFAETITVDGTIQGDLIVCGRQIEINGTIEGDLIAAGQSVSMNGIVRDDVRICGQTLTFEGKSDVGDDLIAAGYSLECSAGSHVGGEVKFAGFQAVFAGSVDRDVKSATANCELQGQFGGDVKLNVDGSETPPPTWFFQTPMPVVPSGLTVSDTATIAGDLDYQGIRKANVSPNASIAGNVTFTQVERSAGKTAPDPTITSRLVAAAKHFIALLVVGVFVVFVFPSWTRKIVNNIQNRPLACFGWGLLSIVGVIAGTILLIAATIFVAITLGLVSLESLLPAWLAIGALATAGLTIGFAIFAVWVAKLFAVMWAGNQIVGGVDFKPIRQLLSLLVGLLLFVALCSTPYVGWIASPVVALFGIGGVAIWFFGGKTSTENLKAKMPPIKQSF